MRIECEKCKGLGLIGDLLDTDCSKCGGRGTVDGDPPKRTSIHPVFPDTEDGRMAKKLCDIEGYISEWETGFVNSIADQVLEGNELTDDQKAKARQIIRERS